MRMNKALEMIALYLCSWMQTALFVLSLFDLCIFSVGTWREWTRRTSTSSLHQTVPSNPRDRSAVSWGMWRPNQSCWKVSKNNLSSLFYLHYRCTFSIYINTDNLKFLIISHKLSLKGYSTQKQKFSHQLLTHTWFQTCMSFFLLWSTKLLWRKLGTVVRHFSKYLLLCLRK